MPDIPHRDPWYWERFDPDDPDAGTDLAHLRRGTSRPPGTVPELWRFHQVTVPDDVVAGPGVVPGPGALDGVAPRSVVVPGGPVVRRPAVVPGPAAVPEGAVTRMLAAEHVALTLFGLHQHGRRARMHEPGTPLFSALRRLRPQARVSTETLDHRVGAAVTVAGLGELATHLRGLVAQLRTAHQPLDYTTLLHDIHDWLRTDTRAHVRRRWGTQYHLQGRRPEPVP